MGRELQKRKRRSSRPKVTMPNRRKKALNPLGNDIIAKNWNKKETLSQNYSRFGLVAKLGKATGGTAPGNKALLNPAADPLAVRSGGGQGLLRVGEVKVERDESGRIKRVLRGDNPLNDPLRDLDSDSDSEEKEKEKAKQSKQHNPHEEWSGFGDDDGNNGDDSGKPEVLRALEREAGRPVEKAVRHQSERELEWLRRLVERHGQDTTAMARNMKLNPMQQTAADIRKRLRKAGLLTEEAS